MIEDVRVALRRVGREAREIDLERSADRRGGVGAKLRPERGPTKDPRTGSVRPLASLLKAVTRTATRVKGLSTGICVLLGMGQGPRLPDRDGDRCPELGVERSQRAPADSEAAGPGAPRGSRVGPHRDRRGRNGSLAVPMIGPRALTAPKSADAMLEDGRRDGASSAAEHVKSAPDASKPLGAPRASRATSICNVASSRFGRW